MTGDPRANPPPLADVPALLAEGARLYDAARYWDAHEAWESAWHALRAAERTEEADFVQGLILATAAVENLRRGKVTGFHRQGAHALWRLRRRAAAGPSLGVRAGFADEFLDFYLDAARRTRLVDLAALGRAPPALGAVVAEG